MVAFPAARAANIGKLATTPGATLRSATRESFRPTEQRLLNIASGDARGEEAREHPLEPPSGHP